MQFSTALRAILFGLFFPSVGALTKSTSLDEPFQDAFKKLEHSGCVTLYHRNGRSGCGTADRESQSGPLFYYDGSSSLPSGQSFVAVIEEYQLSAETISNILAAGTNSLKGILVLNSTDANEDGEYSSPGPIYPLGYTTPSADISYGNIQYPWNGNGDGLNQYDMYGVPVVYINQEEASNYVREASQDSSKAVTIYTEFNYYMGPDGVTSKDCLAWRDANDGEWNPKCLPLGGTSVWAFAGSPPKSNSANANNNNENENGNGRMLDEDANDNNGGNNYNRKSAILVGASTDTTSMFHDLAPGANEGASNILTLIMAAYLLGQSVSDATLDALPKRIVFGFFEGEAYGYLGSRRFLSDIMGFSCKNKYIVHSVAGDENSDKACLYPLRPSLKFKDLGKISGMLTVDQIGVPAGEGQLFVHNDGAGGMGTFLANVLKASSTQYYSAVASAAGNNADVYPYPPTPLTSLLSLTGGQYGGAVLTGYDYAFTMRPPYQSHLNWYKNTQMNLKAIASAATMVARAALAAAYDNGSYDYETAAAYAAKTIGELSSKNEILLELAECLFENGNCQMLKKYSAMEATNERSRTGIDISQGNSLGVPPNYYVGVYQINTGQPFVRVGDNIYGSYNGEDYGKKNSDAFGVQANMLEQALRNMLNDFLGRGSYGDQSGDDSYLSKCSKHSDCKNIGYCQAEGDSATCSANKVCVCNRAYYHIALDEAITPAVNNYTGYFVVSSSDIGVTPMWTEPYWSSDVGVKMYRVAQSNPGYVTLVFGAISFAACFFVTVLVKVGMKKVKVY